MTTVMDHTPAADADVWALIEAEEFAVEDRVDLVEEWVQRFITEYPGVQERGVRALVTWWMEHEPRARWEHAFGVMTEPATSGALVRGEGL